VEVEPGEPVEFSYTTGTLSRLTVEARWSEARDTTLLVWIGLETRTPRRPDACVPVYGNGGDAQAPHRSGLHSPRRAGLIRRSRGDPSVEEEA